MLTLWINLHSPNWCMKHSLMNENKFWNGDFALGAIANIVFSIRLWNHEKHCVQRSIASEQSREHSTRLYWSDEPIATRLNSICNRYIAKKNRERSKHWDAITTYSMRRSYLIVKQISSYHYIIGSSNYRTRKRRKKRKKKIKFKVDAQNYSIYYVKPKKVNQSLRLIFSWKWESSLCTCFLCWVLNSSATIIMCKNVLNAARLPNEQLCWSHWSNTVHILAWKCGS